jgi:hypothetical protein
VAHEAPQAEYLQSPRLRATVIPLKINKEINKITIFSLEVTVCELNEKGNKTKRSAF